jgi:monoamine oxidase
MMVGNICNRKGKLHPSLTVALSSLRCPVGNQQFSQKIASQIKTGSIRLSHPVTDITQNGSGQCLVTCSTSTQPFPVRRKKVVVSVPTALYSHITFSPLLPAIKAAWLLILTWDTLQKRYVSMTGPSGEKRGSLAPQLQMFAPLHLHATLASLRKSSTQWYVP